MRNFKTLIKDLASKPPMVFPFVGLFHILWLVRTTWTMSHSAFGIEWLQVLWLAGYTFFWLATCDLRKWGATGYVILTIIDLTLYLAIKNINQQELYTSSLFGLDIVFSICILIFFKRFGKKDLNHEVHEGSTRDTKS